MIVSHAEIVSWITLVLVIAATSRPHNRSVSMKSNNATKIKTRILSHSFFPSISNSEENSNEQDIIFPDSYEVTFDIIPKIEATPKCAEGGTFCENVESYPFERVYDILQKSRTPTEFFTSDEDPNMLTNRLGETEDNFVCSSVERLIFPKIGKNKNNKWKYIINQGDRDGYVQGVKVEICTRLNGPCDIIGQLPNGYITSCKQKYFYRRLLSLSDSGQPNVDSFKLPSACCCSYKKDVDFFVRFGSTART